MRSIFTLITLLIIYGSLFPFDFDGSAFTVSTLKYFFSTWNAPSGRGDLLGNIILFVPFGFVGMILYTREHSVIVALILLMTLGILLATGCQIAQISIPSRDPVLIDVFWNGIGFFVGVIAAGSKQVRSVINEKQHINNSKIVPILLLGLWLISRLIPFVPTIDWQAYKLALKPLFLHPQFNWNEIILISGAWMACAQLGRQVLEYRWKTVYLSATIIIVLLLQIIIVTQSTSAGDVVAAILAIMLWKVIDDSSQRALIIAYILLIGIIINGLIPFSLSYTSPPFMWLPFGGFLTGSMIINTISLTQKLFLFGAVFLLFREARWRVLPTTILLTVIITLIEIIQIWIKEHTAEITDILLVIALGFVWFRFAPGFPRKTFDSQVSHSQKKTKVASTHKIKVSERIKLPSLPIIPKQIFVLLITGFITMVLAIYFALRLPGMPYNVLELFIHNGSLLDSMFFFLAVTCFGAGAAWAGKKVAFSPKPYITAPWVSFSVTITIYLLLSLCVTSESISDIVGSSVFVHRVAERAVLGQLGVNFVVFFGAENLRALTEIFEPSIRFSALIGPIIFLLISIFSTFFSQTSSTKVFPSSWVAGSKQFTLTLQYFLPWFIICKVIAFDWSSTDNLNELITRDGEFGLGGGGYLYLLIFIISTSAAILAWSIAQKNWIKIIITAVACTALLPVGWWLLDAGLIDEFTKYGITYSGMDFLLGPDRSTHLADIELYTRWLLLQLSIVLALVFGSLIYLKTTPSNSISKKPIGITNRQSLMVRFDEEQIIFIEARAEQLDSSLNSIINSILNDFQSLVHQNLDAKKELKTLLQTSFPEQHIDKKMIIYDLELTSDNKTFLDSIAKDASIGVSRAMNVLVDIFIEHN